MLWDSCGDVKRLKASELYFSGTSKTCILQYRMISPIKICMSDAQHATARPAHHTPICPVNLGGCPEAPVVPATPRSPRASRGSSSLGSAHPGAEGPPSLGQPRNDPTFGGRSPPARGRSPRLSPAGRCPVREAHLYRQRSLPFQPRRAGERAAGKRERGRTAARVCTPAQGSMVPLSGSSSGSRCAPIAETSVRRRGGYDEKREAAEDAARD